MSKKEVVVTRPSIAWILFVFLLLVIKLILILSWRFFSGNFMDGDKSRNDATWWRDASPMYRRRRRSWSWWKKKSRMKRAAWRHSIFWPVALITAGFYFLGWANMTVIFLWTMPVVGWYGFKWLRPKFYVRMTFSGDGSAEGYWMLKPRYAKRLRRWLDYWESIRPEKKTVAKPDEPETVPIPAEYQAAVFNELREELGSDAVLHLQLLADPEDDGLVE